jgi:hypothetical protein
MLTPEKPHFFCLWWARFPSRSRMADRDEFERPVVTHRLGPAQPDFPEAAPPKEPDQAVAVEDQGIREVGAHAMSGSIRNTKGLTTENAVQLG